MSNVKKNPAIQMKWSCHKYFKRKYRKNINKMESGKIYIWASSFVHNKCNVMHSCL